MVEIMRACSEDVRQKLLSWGGADTGQTRSGPTRAMSQLCIALLPMIIPNKIKQYFTFIDLKLGCEIPDFFFFGGGK